MIRRLAFRGRPPSLGARGERLAARTLRRAGYRIIARNLRIGHDEADLVARAPDARTLVIVEVKTRISETHVRPEAHVDLRKQLCLNRLAARLVQRDAFRDAPVRFDTVAVVLPAQGRPTVRHTAGAFESRW